MKFLTPVLAVIAVISLISNVLIYERFNNKKPVVTVGSQPITKFDYETATEQTPTAAGPAGVVALKKLVYTGLVRQAAVKAGVMPTDGDVAARIASLEARSPQIKQQADANPTFQYDQTTDMALENLRIQGVTASEDEIDAFYNRNKAVFAIQPQIETTMVVSQNQVDSGKAEQLLRQNVSNQSIAALPGLHVVGVNGFNINMASLPPDVKLRFNQTLLSTKAGQVATFPLTVPGGQYFLTFKVTKLVPGTMPALKDIKEQVARQVKLQKAVTAPQELVKLYQSNTPVFNNPQYADYFKDIQAAAAQQKTASAP